MSSQPSGSSAPASGSSSPSSAASAPGGPKAPSGPERDWTVEVTERLESTVASIRDKTTVPITKVARAVVFGLVAAVVAVVALLLLVDILVRIIDVYLPFAPYGRRVWIGYAGLSAIFLLAGAFCWSRRTGKPEETQS
jgi:hypothetical protein